MINPKITRALALLFLLGTLAMAIPAADQPPVEDAPEAESLHLGLRADPRDNPMYIPPPAEMLAPGTQSRRADALTFEVRYNDSQSCPDKLPAYPKSELVDWKPEMIRAFTYATQIWSTLLNGSQLVVVHACLYDELNGSPLGYAEPADWYSKFTNAPRQDTSYPIALANQLSHSDLNGADEPEIFSTFNGQYSWYLGTDGQVPAGQYDFVSVVLHELGHGLGFAGGASWDDGNDPVECNGTIRTGCIVDPPRAYDRFVQYESVNLVGGFISPSVPLGYALTSGNLDFAGPAATAANGPNNVNPILFAPDNWAVGSSYSHLDDITYDKTNNALMTSSLNLREAVHHPGPVTLGVLIDEGWSANSRPIVYVEQRYSGFEDGSSTNPFNSVREGTQAVMSGGSVYIRAGSYSEHLTLSRPMYLRNGGGTVLIGN